MLCFRLWRVTQIMLAGSFAIVPFSSVDAQTAEQAHQVVQFYSSQDHFSGNVVVFHEGHVIFNESHGLANQEWNVANSASTRFAIGSVTKQFTAAAILLLQEEGRLKTSDPVNMYYKQAPVAWKGITIKELLLHTSGIPDNLFVSDPMGFERGSQSPQEVVEAVTHRPLTSAPGTRTAYNNVEYILLGLIIEQVSGEDYASFLKQHFFEPLGMFDTGVGWLPQVIPRRASGYSAASSDARATEPFNGTALGGAAAVYSTGADLARWLIALHSDRVLRPESYREMTEGDADGFAFGLNVSTQYGLQDIGHVGDLPGFHVSTEYFPARRTGIIILTNTVSGRNSPGTYAIANDLMQLVSDNRAIVRSTGLEASLRSDLMSAYVGRYRDSTGQEIDISRSGNHLTLIPRLPGKTPSTLRAESPTRFYFAEWDGEVQFDRDNHGALQMMIFAYPDETASFWNKLPDGGK